MAHRHEDALTDVFDPASIIYLSPDAAEPLRGIDKNKVLCSTDNFIPFFVDCICVRYMSSVALQTERPRNI